MESTTRKLGVASVPVGVRICIFSVIAILLLMNLSPVVDAYATKPGRSGKIVAYEDVVRLEPDDSVNWTAFFNVANNSDYKYTDHNLTWFPFFENNTDIRGVTVHSPLAPLQYNMSAENKTITVGTTFRLTPEDIIDGVSEVWFRLPVVDIPVDATIQLRVARVMNIERFNLTYTDYATPSFEYYTDIQLVHDLYLDSSDSNQSTTLWDSHDSWVDYRRWLNISVPGAEVPFDYNFTYMKACFGLFPNEWYYVQADIYSEDSNEMKLLISLSDFGNDGKYQSWIWLAGESYFIPADVDFPFVCTYGMANGVTGIGVHETFRMGTMYNAFHLNASIPIAQNITASNYWFNVLLPALFDRQLITNITINIWISFYNSTDDSSMFFNDALAHTDWNYGGSYLMICDALNLSAYDGEYIDHIRFDTLVYNWTGSANTPEASAMKYWGTQLSGTWEHGTGFTDLYWTGHDGAAYPAGYFNYTMYEKQYFVPYGYFALDSWYFNLTKQSIITIPMDTPDTPLEILEVMQKFEAALIHTDTRRAIDDSWDSVVAFFKWLAEKAWELWVDFIEYVLDLPVIRDIILFLQGVFTFLYGIALWLYDLIVFLFDAMEWFCYWAVRMIYSASIAIVYMVNIFGVISINSALLNVSRTGNGRDFVYAFRAGWKFVLGIITLLISLAIMAISIVSAVVPF